MAEKKKWPVAPKPGTTLPDGSPFRLEDVQAAMRTLAAANTRSEARLLVIKGSNAVGALAEFYASALQDLLAEGEANETALLEKLRAAETALVGGGGPGLIRPGPDHQRHRAALCKLLQDEPDRLTADERAALRFILGEP